VESSNQAVVNCKEWIFNRSEPNNMKRIAPVTFLLIALQSIGFSQDLKTNQTPTAIQGILSAFVQATNIASPTFAIFSATDDTLHNYTRNRAPTFVGNILGGTGIDLTAIPVWSNWDSPPPTGGNPYGGARFNGILVTPDILLQAHHPWLGSGYSPHTFYFVDNNDRTVAATISGHENITGTDIEVVRLAAKVPPTITPALVFATGTLPHNTTQAGMAHHGIPAVWTDQYRELYVGVATLVNNDTVLIFQAAATTPFNSYWATVHNGVVSGDSGAPYMTIVNGRLVAMGTWTSGGSTRGGGSSFEGHVSAINTAIRDLGSATILQTVNVNVFP
jgi:hypothetical protein